MIPLISQAINAFLNLDPESERRFKKLQSKVVALELKPFGLQFQCEFTDKGIKIHTDSMLEAETTIRGTPLQMMGVMLNKNERQKFFAEDVMIEGNAELGQQVIALFDELQIDWEEYLSHLIGDSPAHHAGRTVSTIKNFISNAADSFKQNISEYVHEETEWFPQREALQDLFNDIDALQMDVDRAEARINELRNILNESHH